MRKFTLLAAFILTACASQEDVARYQAQQEVAACAQAGYQAGTPAFDDCMQQTQSGEEQKKAARISAVEAAQPLRPGSSPAPSGVTIPLP